MVAASSCRVVGEGKKKKSQQLRGRVLNRSASKFGFSNQDIVPVSFINYVRMLLSESGNQGAVSQPATTCISDQSLELEIMFGSVYF